MGLKLDEIQLNDLGQVGELVVTKDDCLMMKGRGDSNAIAARVEQIKDEMSETNSDYEREKFQERLAKLVGGVAVIKVRPFSVKVGLSFCGTLLAEKNAFNVNRF